MSVMSELHADRERLAHITAGLAATEAWRDALHEVSVRAQVAERCPDTEATKKALREVSWAVVRAAEILNTIERETREAALEAASRRSAT